MISSPRSAVLAVLLLCAAPRALGQATGVAFLNVDPSPRSYALGAADVIADPGAQAVDRNPALMGLMVSKYEAFTAYQTLISNASYEHVAFAFQPSGQGPLDAVGVGITRLDLNNIQATDAFGNPTGGTFNSGNMAVALGASFMLLPNLRFGADGKAVQSQIGSYKSNWALAADAGLTWTSQSSYLERPVTLAAVADNFGQGQRFITQTDRLPAAVKLGLGMPVFSYSNVFLQVSDLVYDHVGSASAGVEYAYNKAVAFRVGYNYQFQGPTNLAVADQSAFASKAISGLSGGIGLRWGAISLDYAVGEQAVDYGATQRVALTISWGEPREVSEIRDIKPDRPAQPKPAQDWGERQDWGGWIIR